MTTERSTPVLPVFGRIFWMIFGPGLLLILVVAGFNKGAGWFTTADFVFLAILGGLILARWCEFRGGSPKTNMGEPATWAHFRRYVLITIPLGLGAWVLANLLENHWLTR